MKRHAGITCILQSESYSEKHIILFQLHDILEKGKGQWPPGVGGWRDGGRGMGGGSGQ
jgi:hypothetical protein